jgi:DNA invertase Pin-like site-specific DNA recombinase
MPLVKYDHAKLSKQIETLAKTNTMREVASKLGLTKTQLVYICQKNGISFRVDGKKTYNQILEKEDIPLIKELRKSGMSTALIAKKFECGQALIRQVLNGRAWNGQ